MLTLTAPDGTLLVYDMYEAAAPRAAILALHGWADHAGRWRDVGERLCAAGSSTCAVTAARGAAAAIYRASASCWATSRRFVASSASGPTARSCCSAPRSAGW